MKSEGQDSNEIRRPIDCIPVSPQNHTLKELLVSDAEPSQPCLHLLDVYNDIKYSSSISDISMKDPFGLCHSGDQILLSDPKVHCIFKVDIGCKSVIPFVGERGNEGRDDGPLEPQSSPALLD